MNLNTGGTMVAIGTSMTNINNGISELIILADHWITHGAGDMTQEQGYMLAGLISPFVALLYAKLGIATATTPPTGNDSAAPDPVPARAVAAIIAMFTISSLSLVFGNHLRT